MLKSDWFEKSLSKFDEAYSLIKCDVQAPVTINELKSTMDKLKETRDCSKLAKEGEHTRKNNEYELKSETMESFT